MKIFEFVKKVFFVGLTILSGFESVNLLNAIPLKCISMNNQECKTRPQVVNVIGGELVFFPFSTETSKGSGSCNIINYPYAKNCVPDVVKNVNVKVLNLMSRTNETRHIELHETCKCKCKFGANICNNKQRWNKDKCRCECKELIDKWVCDKGFIWNASNGECEYDKACDVGEYLDYENWKCRKKLVAPLIEQCTETAEEVKLAKITPAENENSYKCSSCTVYIVLFWIFFTINIGGIGTYFVYFYLYLKKDSPYVDFNTHKETTIY